MDTDSKVTKPDIGQIIDVNFESHPPIEDDLKGVAALLRQSILHFADCDMLAQYIIDSKDITQIIASASDEDETNVEEEDEPDDYIYGVISSIDLTHGNYHNAKPKEQLAKFLSQKSPQVKELLSEFEKGSEKIKIAVIINERYINLPPQLSLPTLTNLTFHLDKSNYTHLIFISKILLRARNTDTKLPSKKSKSSASKGESKHNDEPIIYVNPEEEIIFESCSASNDIDVSSHCDENATWLVNSDVKYIPHRRIMLIEYKNWHGIIDNIKKELNL